MIVLYHCANARSFRALWMLEELGLPYELRMLPFTPRVLKKDDLDINPLGTIPLLLDGAARLTESAAICQYLAVKHSPRALNVEPDEPGFADYLNFLHFGEATLTFPQTLLLRYGQFEPPQRRQPQVVDDYGKWFLARLGTLQPRLEAAPTLAAGRFTAADVSVGYALLLADVLQLSAKFGPALVAYWQRLQQRAAFQRALLHQHKAAREQGVGPAIGPA